MTGQESDEHERTSQVSQPPHPPCQGKVGGREARSCSRGRQSRSALYASCLLVLVIAGMRTIGHTHRHQHHSRKGQLTSPSALTGTTDSGCQSGWHDMQLETTLALDQELHGVPVMVNDQVWEPGAECGMKFRFQG